MASFDDRRNLHAQRRTLEELIARADDEVNIERELFAPLIAVYHPRQNGDGSHRVLVRPDGEIASVVTDQLH